MKRTFNGFIAFTCVFSFLSCSGYNSSNPQANRSGLRSRAFVSNPVFPNAFGGGSPVLQVVDASTDLLSPVTIQLSTISFTLGGAGMLSVSANHDRTLVMSPGDSKLGVVDNVKESLIGTFTLPGPSESFFPWTDNLSVFVAIPTAPVTGQAPGVVEKLDSTTGTAAATLAIPGAHYLVPSPDGKQILVLSDNNNVTLIAPSLIGTQGQGSLAPCTSNQVAACIIPVTFDHPVWAVFDSSGSTVYVLNCGAECGGSAASISAISLAGISSGSGALAGTVPVPAATTALLQGSTLYVAGTQPGGVGNLAVINLASALSNISCGAQPAGCRNLSITDGYHNRIAMGANGQLFVGARGCSSTCLAIFDTNKSTVVIPTTAGPVTGIEPIPNRNVVYVCQGGALLVYDTTTDRLATIPNVGQPNIAGQAIDVKTIDF